MSGIKKPRPKKCKTCKERFQPEKQLQEACSIKCALELAQIKEKKKRDKEHRERKKELRPMSYWLNETQKVFNEYIRLRDDHLPCISCGSWDSPEWCAGHFRTRGAASQLRFNEDNVHKQCNHYCNQKLSGNISKYRPNLIAKIGLERVEALEADNSTKKWTREELAEIKAKYKAKIEELKAYNDFMETIAEI